jgi:hypothetical protein
MLFRHISSWRNTLPSEVLTERLRRCHRSLRRENGGSSGGEVIELWSIRWMKSGVVEWRHSDVAMCIVYGGMSVVFATSYDNERR